MLAPFVTLADVKARNAREAAKRGKRKVRHYFWTADGDLAREFGTQARSICGRWWGWPYRGPWDLTPRWRPAKGEPCKICIRIYESQRQQKPHQP